MPASAPRSLPAGLRTLVDVLAWRAGAHPDTTACIFLEGGTEVARLSFAALFAEARRVAARLTARGLAGKRALLLYPSGRDYVVAFWGCLLAGVVAVPVYPPHDRRGLTRLGAILKDATPAVALTTAALHLPLRARMAPHLAAWKLGWIATDTLDDAPWERPAVDAETLAFLQYTSGSTGSPKGVMVSHGNLLENAALIESAFAFGPEAVIVCWVPLYHDLGLIGHMIQAVVGGFPCVMMPPHDFLAQPLRWLEAISRYGGTHSGAPNFAYDLCVRRIPPEARAGLDLSRWTFASNCAEPVRAGTLERFAEAFAPRGFSAKAFRPTYGLAEVTLLGTIAPPDGTLPRALALDPAALGAHEARDAEGPEALTVVGCGRPWGTQQLAIVDPASMRALSPGAVGEIWLAGPNVAGGYWGRPLETAETFAAHTADGEGPYLRTGDLGFVRDGELFVTGRLKDLLILRGRNVYPQDLEASAIEASPALRPGGAAAFSVEVGGEERPALVAELRPGAPKAEAAAILEAVRRAWRLEHGVTLYAAALLPPGSLPKTSSGKVQRRAAKAAFEGKRLEGLHRDRLDEAAWLAAEEAQPTPAAVATNAAHPEAAPEAARPDVASSEAIAALEARIAAVWRELLGVAEVGPEDSFFDLGGTSILAVRASEALREREGIELPLPLLFEAPTIRALASRLAGAAPAAPTPVRPRPAREAVAIVAADCRVPGADGLEAFWEGLLAGVEARETFADDALRAAGVPEAAISDPRYVKAGPVLGELGAFDAAFFGLSPREAALLDPQQRIFLELAWRALERAGVAPGDAASGRVGVFAGSGANQYFARHLAPRRALMASLDDFQLATLADKDFLATRVAHALDLRGPAMTVQTACSTSLVAVHQACASLLAGECDLALAGGVAVQVGETEGYMPVEGSVRSTDGRCRAFDAEATGTPFGSGAGVVVLKRLSDVASGERVLAVIKGTAVNNDGGTKASFTAPSAEGQARVISEALAVSGVEARTVGYVEAHGTGTALGDPIELAGLTAAYRASTPAVGYCALGSLKTNLGHLDAAAGVVGLIKAALCVSRGVIVPSLHFEQPNPRLGLESSPFYVASERREWPEPAGHPRRAGVSSFGIGGTNAHAVLEAWSAEPEAEAVSEGPEVLVLSAKTPEALEAMSDRLATHLKGADLSLAAVARTLTVGRKAFRFRRIVVASTLAEAAEALEQRDPERVWTAEAPARPPRVVAMVPGQGTHRPGSGRTLYASEPVYREAFDRCAEILEPLLGLDLRETLYGSEADAEALARPAIAQPALVALAYAAGALWRAAGVAPDAFAGHSAGEIAAAALAGACDLEDALAFASARGEIFERVGGAMIAVPLPAAELAGRLGPGLEIAAFNGPALCAVAGPSEAVAALADALEAEGLEVRRDAVPHAAHCALLEPHLPALTEAAARAAWRAPERPFALEAGRESAAPTPEAWARHAREPVRFAEGLTRAAGEGPALLLDLGPGQAAATYARAIFPARPAPEASPVVLAGMARTRRPDEDRLAFLAALGRAWLHGAPVDWRARFAGRSLPAVPLPTYPFARETHWIPRPSLTEGAAEEAPVFAAAAERAISLPDLPRPGTEAAIAAVFEALLGVGPLGRGAHFFECGGHSLLATQAVHRLGAAGIAVTIEDLFAAPTVAGLAARAGAAEALAPIPRLARGGPLALSFAQERLFFLEQLEPGARYNLPHAARLEGPLDPRALERALAELVVRHEAFRTTFHLEGGRAVQRVAEVAEAPAIAPGTPGYVDVSGAADPEAEAYRLASAQAHVPFDLARGPLLRVTLFRLGPETHWLLLAMHHLIADGWSMGVVIAELGEAYAAALAGRAPSPALLAAQVVDFAAWQREQLDEAGLAPGLAYWKRHLAAPLPRLGLPGKAPGVGETSCGARVSRALSPALGRRISEAARSHGVTPFVITYAAYLAFLHRLTGQTDLLVSVPVAARSHPDVERTVGFFVNSLALRADASGDPAFATLVARAREVALGGFAHQDVPLQKVVEAVAPARGAAGLDLVEAAFALQNAPLPALSIGALRLEPVELETRVAKLDLLLELTPDGEGYRAAMEYRTDRFEEAAVTAWLAAYAELLDAVLARPEAPLSALGAPSAREALASRTNLSPEQLLVWLGHLRHAPAPLYTLATARDFAEEIDPEAFAAAFADVARASDALRTVARLEDGAPRAQVLAEPPFALAIEDLGAEPDPAAAAEARIRARLAVPFDVAEACAASALYRLGPARWVWFVAAHHLVMDGGGLAALHRHVLARYAARRASAAPEPLALPSFAEALASAARPEAPAPEAGAPPEPPAFFGRPPARGGTRVFRTSLSLGAERSRRLRELAGPRPLGAFSCFAGALLALMHRHGGSRDAARFALGVPFHGRATAAERDTIGLLMTLAPLVVEVSPALAFKALAARVETAALDALAAGPRAAANPDADRAYDVALNYLDHASFGDGGPVRWLHAGYELDTLFLQIHDRGPDAPFELDFDCHEAVFDTARAEALAAQFLTLLDAALAQPALAVGEAPWLAPEAEAAVLALGVGPALSPAPLVLEAFEGHVEARPGALAVRDPDGRAWRYAELHARARAYAWALVSAGVRPGDRVAVALPRSAEAVSALLGTWLAGAAYVPVDPSYPAARVAWLLEDAAPAALVAEPGFGEAGLPRVVAEAPAPEDWTPPGAVPDGLAYVLYTSGSTGQPKGVEVEHRALAALAAAWGEAYALTPSDVHLQLASMAFDVFTGDLARALAHGGALAIVPDEERLDPPALRARLEVSGATVAEFVPTVLTAFADHLAHVGAGFGALRLVIAGSEPWSMAELARIRALAGPGARVLSSYGLTEATIDTSVFEATAVPLAPEAVVPIGRPLPGTRLHVLDPAGRPLPAGVPGEIAVGGAGVARGYRNRPELTAERFVTSPFGRLYLTGDRGVMLEDGTVQTLGRSDDQLKLRGQRIEPAEIEAALRAHPGVAEAAVGVLPGGRSLVAFVAPRADDEAPADPGAEAGRVSAWERVYDEDAAASSGVLDPRFDITGWTSRFSREPIPAREMRAWRDATLDRIRALAPKRVLEIGVGSGLLLFELAPELESYVGTDFSAPSLARLAPHVAAWPHVSLVHAEADALPEGRFDVVVLNSVSQYFPSADYLRRVLEGALARLAPGGALFVGDVRALAQQDAFEAEVAARRFPDEPPASRALRIARGRRREPELLVDPAFFEALPGAGRVSIQLKRGTDANEMTVYRYDAVLRPDAPPALTPARERDWAAEGLSRQALAELLAEGAPGGLLVRGVPNARLGFGLAALAEAGLGARPAGPGLDPEALFALAEACGLHAEVRFSRRSPGTVDVCFAPDARFGFAPAPLAGRGTNDPLAAERDDALATALRERLAETLPSAWVPARIAVLPALPRTPNGKLDRRALLEAAGEPAESAPAAAPPEAPRTPEEALLAEIWASVLGLDAVGRDDNFFALGGDSIMSLQVVSRATERGLRVTPRLLFEHQTIAGLAAAALAEQPASEAPVGPWTGPARLSPIQRWFFERGWPAPHHFNQALMLRATRPLDPERLGRALDLLVSRHEMLRARFAPGPAGWTQTVVPEAPPVGVSAYDLGAMPAEAQDVALAAIAGGLQASFDLEAGPLLRAAVFRLGPARGDRLFLAAHHLVVDGVSWRILLAELALADAALEAGETPLFGPPGLPFPAWAERLAQVAPAAEDERAYWAAQPWGEAASLPLDFPEGVNDAGSARTLTVALGEAETRALIEQAGLAYASRVDEALLAALALALRTRTGAARHAVIVEGHGRELPGDDGLDVSRTVGWFTTLHPLLLSAPTDEPGDALVRAKEAARAVPRRGLGYGLLTSPPGPERAAISFNYLGRFDAGSDPMAGFALAPEPVGAHQAPDALRPTVLALDAIVANGTLALHWTYSAALHREETVRALAEAHLDALRRVLAHCLAPGAGAHTPADFPLARLTRADLARLAPGSRPAAPTIETIAPLAPMQQGMLFHTLLAPDSGDYVLQASLDLDGPLDPARFEAAWRGAVSRHAILRTSFHWEGLAEPLQVVHREAALSWELLDWIHLSPEAQAAAFAEREAAERRRGFDPAKAPLMRLALVKLGPDRHRFLWSAHHALLDGWSSALLVHEVFERYAGRADFSPARGFTEHVSWLRAQAPEPAAAYWRAALAGWSAPTPLPLARLREGAGRVQAASVLGPEAVRRLEAFARGRQLTLGALVQGAWALLLAKGSGERTVCFGTVSAGRPASQPGREAMIGPFLVTIPQRADCDPERPLGAWLAGLQAGFAEAREHEHLALDRIQALGGAARGTPLFESLVVFENYPLDGALAEGGGGLRPGRLETRDQTHYPLTLTALPGPTLELRLDADAGRYDAPALETLLSRLEALLMAFPERAEAPLGALGDPGAPAEPFVVHGPAVGPAPLVLEAFEGHVEARPGALAVRDPDGRAWRYAELHARARAYAWALVSAGVRPGDRVAVALPRSAEAVSALLGTWLAGAAYVPVDPSYPAARVAWLLEDAAPAALVAEPGFGEAGLPRVEPVGPAPEDWTPPGAVPDGLAYVLYTSGSTGQPKGVEVEHRALAALIDHFALTGRLAPGAALLAVTTFAFDIAALELFWPLSTGAAVSLVSTETARDPKALAAAIAQASPTVMQATPSTWRMLVADGWEGAEGLAILSGGEPLPRDLADALLARGSALWNLYGPTETTIWSSMAVVAPGAVGPVPIGEPIAGTWLGVRDLEGGPVAAGVPGELWIGGAGVARGYRNRPELTAERFVETPMGRAYRTGDRARWWPDGTIELLGRLDDQLKVAGRRVEPAEVEAALRSHPGLADAAVAVHDGRLVAYVVLHAGALDPAALRAHAAALLPAAIVPSRFVALPALPLTPNGKRDRRALPAPEGTREEAGAGSAYEPPDGPLETAIAEVLQEVLGLERVGALDNFFELGGGSLLALQALSALQTRLGRELPLAAIFASPTPRSLAASLSGEAPAAAEEGTARAQARKEAEGGRQGRLAARRAARGGTPDA